MEINKDYSLYPYQEKCVKWMNERDRGIVFAEMGLGKTLMTLKFLCNKDGPHLVVCGKTLIGSWVNEIKKFCKPRPKIFIYHNEFNKNLDVDLTTYDIVLTTYGKIVSENKVIKVKPDGEEEQVKISDFFFYKVEIEGRENYRIRDHKNRICKGQKLYGVYWSSIVVDECQSICNWKTARYQAIYSLPSKRIFGLSGTPIKNDRTELIGLSKMLRIKDYNYPSQWKKENTEIRKNLFDMFYTLTYATAGMKLPPIKEEAYELDFSDKSIVMINDYINMWNEYVRVSVENNQQDKMTKLMSLFTRLRQIAIDPHLIGLTEKGEREHVEITNGPVPDFGSEKFDKLNEIIKNTKGERFIVFSFFSSYLELIDKKLVRKTYMVKSKYSINQRFKIIRRWQRSKDGILLMNYKLGAEGLNLTEATQIVLLDSWFNFTCESQAIARAHRIGQTKEVTVHRLVYKSSIEIIMYRKCREKRNLFYKLKNREEIKPRGSVMSYDNMCKYLNALQGGVAAVLLERDLDPDEIEEIRKYYTNMVYFTRDIKIQVIKFLFEHKVNKILEAI